MLEQDVSVSGEMNIPALTFKKSDIQFLFQSTNGTGQGRLGNVKGLRSFG